MSGNPFTQALGDTLERLPDPIREHFAMSEGTRYYRGSMSKVWRRKGVRGLLAAPALRLAAAADMLFAETGSDVGFSLCHRVQTTSEGPTMVWSRQFHFANVTRRFDAVMIYSEGRGCIVDWLGGNGGLEVELHPRLIDRGIELVSGKQWLRLGRANLPLPGWIAGKAIIREWLDSDDVQRIKVTIRNPLLGDFFGYEGSFKPVSGDELAAVPEIDVPEPAVVVPVWRWLLLALVAIVGTVAIAASFLWTDSNLLQKAGVAVGLGSGIAWLGFGAFLLRAAPSVPAVTWADTCLRTMAAGMAVLSTIFFINLSLHRGVLLQSISPWVYAAIVLAADVAMATTFIRRAAVLGLAKGRALLLWLLVLNGLCALVIATWLRFVR